MVWAQDVHAGERLAMKAHFSTAFSTFMQLAALCGLGLGFSGPAQAVDGCKVLLCMAGNWQHISECEPTVRDVALGRSLSAIVLSWFVFFALGMSLYASEKVVFAIADGSAFVTSVPNSIGALEAAGTYLAVMCPLAIVRYQAPSLASSLTGGH